MPAECLHLFSMSDEWSFQFLFTHKVFHFINCLLKMALCHANPYILPTIGPNTHHSPTGGLAVAYLLVWFQDYCTHTHKHTHTHTHKYIENDN